MQAARGTARCKVAGCKAAGCRVQGAKLGRTQRTQWQGSRRGENVVLLHISTHKSLLLPRASLCNKQNPGYFQKSAGQKGPTCCKYHTDCLFEVGVGGLPPEEPPWSHPDPPSLSLRPRVHATPSCPGSADYSSYPVGHHDGKVDDQHIAKSNTRAYTVSFGHVTGCVTALSGAFVLALLAALCALGSGLRRSGEFG